MKKLSRQTKQKALVEQHILKFKTFFTAEELYSRIIKDDVKIGIATIYRFLKDLRKKRLLHSYTCDKKTLYSTKKRSHCHFTCEKCGQISHFDIQKIDFIKEKTLGDICHFQLDITGICNNCKK